MSQSRDFKAYNVLKTFTCTKGSKKRHKDFFKINKLKNI